MLKQRLCRSDQERVFKMNEKNDAMKEPNKRIPASQNRPDAMPQMPWLERFSQFISPWSNWLFGKVTEDKFEHYEELPNEIKNKIASLLPTTDFINLSKTAKSNSPFFSTNQYLNQGYKVRKLLHHVVRGNHEAVIAMLENNPSLMCIRGQVKDLSGREFFNISGFEYCLWALDKHLWTKMLSCVPKTQEGEQIMTELRTQYQTIKEHGVTYTLHGVTKYYMPETITKTEKHFDFEGTIIKELQDCVDNYNDNQWKKGVGGSQRLLPAHVVHEYCSETPFDPLPDFTKQPVPSRKFYNFVTDSKESWFGDDSKLGEDFGIYKGRALGAALPVGGARGRACRDLIAIKALYEVRTNDFLALEKELKPCSRAENQFQY